MKAHVIVAAALLGTVLVPCTPAPAGASLAALTRTAVGAHDAVTIEPARFGGRGGGGMRGAGMRGGAGMNRGAMNRANFAGANRANIGRNANLNRGANRNVNRNVNRNINRTTVGAGVGRAGGWARPGRYWWPAGGAVAAGAALGVVGAATAASWAGPAPGPGMCWYYTDASKTQGFWDSCSQ
jgi:hypothetical protein